MRLWLFAPLRDKVTSSACSIGCSPQAEDQVCIEMIAQAGQVWVRPFTRPAASISPNGTLWNVSVTMTAYSALMFAATVTLHHFLAEPAPVVRGRAADHAAAQVGKPQLQLGVRQRRVNLLVQFVNDLTGRVPGCADTYPCSRIITRHKLTQRWDVRQDLRARRSGDRQCAHFAGLDVLNGRRGEHHLHLPTYDVGKRGLSAAIGDMY